MESINNAFNIITLKAYMASIDLKGAFFSAPIHPTHQKYLKACVPYFLSKTAITCKKLF